MTTQPRAPIVTRRHLRRARVALCCGWLAACGGTSPAGPDRAACGASYPAQDTSPYVLPYPVGLSFRVDQGNCSDFSHSPESLARYAYDFTMPIGTEVVAARAGRVLLVEERFDDGTRVGGEENYVNVQHDDGTIAGYVHLTRGGALVDVGEPVEQGQPLGLSGDSGSSTAPHLHFHVQACSGCATVPVTFRNTRAHPHGLQVGQECLAEPY